MRPLAGETLGQTPEGAMNNIENVRFEQAPPSTLPKCPHCQKPLDRIWMKTEGMGFYGKQAILICPHCETFLGYNAWKRM